MKKIALIASMMLAFAGFTFGQAPAKKDKKAKAATEKTAPAASTPAAAPGPKKADGTPDMRYKANKDAAKAAPATTHLKKDGTPDKRYKENKPAKTN